MLCVTGNEPTAAEWLARVEACDRRAAGAPLLHELRLDALEAPNDDAFAALARHAARAIVCCRPTRQGGAFAGDEAARLELLRRAAATGVRWLDVEADVTPDTTNALAGALRSHDGALILSWHDFAGLPVDLAARARVMSERTATDRGAVKIAVAVSDAADIARLVAAFEDIAVPHVAIAMGPAGLLSRTHYAALGSAWSYVAATTDAATAPGQIDLETALAWGMPDSAREPLFALLGGEQVLRSPGPRVYNRFLRARGDRSSYVPIVAKKLGAVLPLLDRLGTRGLSVTMPLKLEALTRCRPDAIAREVGAVNSLRRHDHWEGTNTDVEGIRAPLAALVQARLLRRAVILGSGGAARAAAMAARRLGLKVEVCARQLEVARQVARAGSRAGGKAFVWDERPRTAPLRDAVLINATPIAGSESPWPDHAPLDAAVVFDTALGAAGSRLLERARTSGAVTLGPERMWLAQGAAQMSWFLGEKISAAELEAP
jgi:3-dehydroquinate dehydratase type I